MFKTSTPGDLPVSTGSELSVSHLVTAQGAAVVSDAHLFQQGQASVSAGQTHTWRRMTAHFKNVITGKEIWPFTLIQLSFISWEKMSLLTKNYGVIHIKFEHFSKIPKWRHEEKKIILNYPGSEEAMKLTFPFPCDHG